MADIRHDLSAISAEVRALPAALAKELDDRSVQRVESLKTETDLRLSPLENRIARLERIVWGVITFVFVADGGALMALIIKR